MGRQVKVEEFEGLVRSTVRAFVGKGESANDLIQEAWVAVLESIDAYKEDCGVSLHGFLKRKILTRIARAYRQEKGLVSKSRLWVAESCKGPDHDIVAKSRAECVRQYEAVAHTQEYRKPRRVTEYAPIWEQPERSVEDIQPPMQDEILQKRQKTRLPKSQLFRCIEEFKRPKGVTDADVAEAFGVGVSGIRKARAKKKKRVKCKSKNTDL